MHLRFGIEVLISSKSCLLTLSRAIRLSCVAGVCRRLGRSPRICSEALALALLASVLAPEGEVASRAVAPFPANDRRASHGLCIEQRVHHFAPAVNRQPWLPRGRLIEKAIACQHS